MAPYKLSFYYYASIVIIIIITCLADKLSQSRERELRRALFALKQMFQVEALSFVYCVS